MESEVDAALALLLEQGTVPLPDLVKELVNPEKPPIPNLAEAQMDLTAFDALLCEVAP